MTPLIELISAWEDFSLKSGGEISVKAFCEFYLSNEAVTKKQEPAASLDHELAKVIGRLGSIHKTYSKIAFRQLPGVEFEWYFLLFAIREAGEIRKTEVVSINLLLEPTTCIDIINRMIKAGLVNERIDPTDKRARLLQISTEGKSLLAHLQTLMNETSTALYGQLAPEDKTDMIRKLTQISQQHSRLLLALNKKNGAKQAG